MVVVVLLQSLWLTWFLRDRLPNAGTVPIRRVDLLLRALPEVIPDVKFRESFLGLAVTELSHVENLPQRAPIVLAAAAIATAALATGSLALRLLRLGRKIRGAERLAIAYGLGTIGLGTLTLLLGRMGWLGPWLTRGLLVLPVVAEAFLIGLGRKSKDASDTPPVRWFSIRFGVVVAPFVILMALGAMLPTIDFDAIEYHLQGPKEYYQAGRIAFLPHNVYTSMPFGIEMLHLLGMEVVDDWWLGALVGQLLVAGFAPAAAVLIGGAAARLGSPRAGRIAAAVYLTTPWIYRLAVLPYVEGPLCYFHAALVWTWARGVGSEGDEPIPLASLAPLSGLLAGGAMATKYPGLISAVIPFGLLALIGSWKTRSFRVVLGFSLGVAVVIGPWLVKNVIDTGNPVYPLGYRVFGGSHWDPAMDAKWQNGHGPKPIEAGAFWASLVDVAGRSDWQSPLYLALAPLAWLRVGSKRSVGWLTAFAAYLFLTWWLLTHRLDRFWLPILPPLAVLAGLGSDWFRGRFVLAQVPILLVGFATNLVYCSTALAGFNEWTGDLTRLRVDVPRMLNPALARLDAELPASARPLLVGQAAVFHLRHRVAYNTVFNREGIEEIVANRPPAEIRAELKRRGITHVYVDWFEIERYRAPFNYGFTPFVTPELFSRLVSEKVLRGPTKLGAKQELYEVAPAP